MKKLLGILLLLQACANTPLETCQAPQPNMHLTFYACGDGTATCEWLGQASEYAIAGAIGCAIANLECVESCK